MCEKFRWEYRTTYLCAVISLQKEFASVIANEVIHQGTNEISCGMSGSKEVRSHIYNQMTSLHQPLGMSICLLFHLTYPHPLFAFCSDFHVSQYCHRVELLGKGLVDLARAVGRSPVQWTLLWVPLEGGRGLCPHVAERTRWGMTHSKGEGDSSQNPWHLDLPRSHPCSSLWIQEERLVGRGGMGWAGVPSWVVRGT